MCDSGEYYAQVMVSVKYFDHLTGPGNIDGAVGSTDKIAVVREIFAADQARIDPLLHDPCCFCHSVLSIFSLLYLQALLQQLGRQARSELHRGR